MNQALNAFAAALLGLSASAGAGAATIVDWDLTGLAGNEASVAANSFAAGVTGFALTRGAGLTPSAGANAFNAANWTGETTDYFSFGFNVGAGYEVDLISLTIATRSSNTGPGTLGLYYSGDGFTSALYTFNQAPGSNFVNSIVALSSLQNLTGNVEFRIAQIGTTAANGGPTGSAGTFRIAEYTPDAGVTFINVNFDGTVVATIPEADSYAMMLAGLGLVGFAAWRRRSQSAAEVEGVA